MKKTPAENLFVVADGELTLPHLGRKLRDFKIRDKNTGEIVGVLLDELGTPANRDQLMGAERSANRGKYGSLTAELSDRVSGLQENDTVPVIIWAEGFSSRPFNPKANLASPESDKDFADWLASHKASVHDHMKPFVDRFRKAGINGVESDNAPLFFAKLNPSEIAKIRNFPGVTAYIDGVNSVADSNSNVASKNAIPGIAVDPYLVSPNYLAPYTRGDSKPKIAGIEAGRIDFTKYGPYFVAGGINRENLDPTCSGDTTTEYHHNLWVASQAAGTNNGVGWPVQGASPKAYYVMAHVCNGNPFLMYDSDITKALDWALTQRPNVINMSLGSPDYGTVGALARTVDYYAWTYNLPFVIAAGNQGLKTEYVISPGTAYNAITVGNFSTNGTVYPTSISYWEDDFIYPESSWRNPLSAHGDREKPEVVAPGTDIAVWSGRIGSPDVRYTDSDVIRGTGTSLAAPHVSGIIAGLQDNSNAILPAQIKATILATAMHGFKYSSRDYAGVGGVNAARAETFVRSIFPDNVSDSTMNLSGKVNTVPAGSTFLQGNKLIAGSQVTQRALEIYANVGERVRVAIAWQVDPSYANYPAEGSADLDIYVVDLAGNYVTGSYSWDNNYEFVEFVSPISTKYNVYVDGYRVSKDTIYGAAADVLPDAWTVTSIGPGAGGGGGGGGSGGGM